LRVAHQIFDSCAMPASLKRRAAPHTQVNSSTVLNALPVEVAKTVYDGLASKATKDGDCLFPSLQIRHGDYPRYKISKTLIQKLISSDLQKQLLAKDTKTRVFYHQLAWRACGNLVPDFESGSDLSHKCRRGQMRKPGTTTSFDCASEKMGCFSMQCIEVVHHTSNLSRGRCTPIIACPNCKLYFNNCKHNPICGTDLAGLYNSQRQLKRICIEYMDGTIDVIE